MNEAYIRFQYKLYGHEGFASRIGALDCQTKDYREAYLNGIGEILEFIQPYLGKRNLFISRAAINPDRSFRPSWVSTFDLDPLREKDTASTDRQHECALEAGYRILQRFPGGYLASSGNGALLIYRWQDTVASVENYYDKEKLFIETVLQPLVQDLNIKVDNTSYEKAITKLIGTRSTKGDREYHRLSRFITFNLNSDESKLQEAIAGLVLPIKNEDKSKFVGDPIRRIKDAQDTLNQLPSSIVEEYERWLKVGMALKEFGISGLQLWKEWSKQSEKYEEGCCEKKWETLEEVPEITLGTLKYWASESLKLKPASRSSTTGDDYFSKLFQPDSESNGAITTGISSLDAVLRALPKGEITTIAARSGFGKSSFACTVADYVRKRGKRVLYFSTEMAVHYIMHKFVSIATGIPLQSLIQKVLSDSQRERIRAYEQELLRTPLIICDEFSPKIELVKALVEEHKPDLLIFDHATQSGTHYEYVAQFVRGLKELTTTYGLVTLLASQLNEPPRGSNGTVGASVRGDVRGSQEILFLSALFMMMNNLYDVKTDVQPVELEMCKNRFGVSGIKLEIHVDKTTGRFS